MVLMTKNRRLGELIQRAYERAGVKDDQVLVVWNARVYLDGTLGVMESACPIFLDKIIEQLRVFTGSKVVAPSQFLWVRASGNRARRWSHAQPRALPKQEAPIISGGRR